MEIIGDYTTGEGNIGVVEWDPTTKFVYIHPENGDRRKIGSADSRVNAFSLAIVLAQRELDKRV